MDSDDLSRLRGEIGRRSVDDVRIAQILEDLRDLNRRLLGEDSGIIPRLFMEVMEIKSMIGKERLTIGEENLEDSILAALDKGKLNFTELLGKTRVTKPTLSKHLKSLESKGVISRKRVGRTVEYWLVRSKGKPIFYK
ncbi:MAG: winged helix-turn-helix transcriptional regulator [Candidatus Altiarchaeota archaeon]|nr:winged helix-turn-helix transcriptional regulator [Candidatus Altiarchaeota archaeon]